MASPVDDQLWGIERLVTEQGLGLALSGDRVSLEWDPHQHAYRFRLYVMGDQRRLLDVLSRLEWEIETMRKDVIKGGE